MSEKRSLAARIFPLREGATRRSLWLTVLLAAIFGVLGAVALSGGGALSARGIPFWLLGVVLVGVSAYYVAGSVYHYRELKRREERRRSEGREGGS